VLQNNPFHKAEQLLEPQHKKSFYFSLAVHSGILLTLILFGVIANNNKSIPTGGGEFVSVEMIILDTGEAPAEIIPEEVQVVEEVQEEVIEVIEENPEEIEEVVERTPEEVIEETPEETEVVEEVQESQASDFIGVGSTGEAGTGAPGPASYEGRVFSAIRRNFRTSVNPNQSYQISFTVNLDGTHSFETLRNSGDSSFDRAVTHALNSANIPPIPPGRTSPVNLNIEFFGPDDI